MFKKFLNLNTLKVAGCAGWGATINALAQAVLSPLTGVSVMAGAFHPATLLLGGLGGLAILGFYLLIEKQRLRPVSVPIYHHSLTVISIQVCM